MSKHILVFGPTGGTGRAFVEQALAAGHRVTAFARSPEKLSDLTSDHLSIAQGDLFDADSVIAAVPDDVDAVFCAFGFFNKKPATLHKEAQANINAALHAKGIRRIVIISSLMAGDSKGQGSFMAKTLVAWVLRHTIPDKTEQEHLIQTDRYDWTILRPPGLRDGAAEGGTVAWRGTDHPSNVSWWCNRPDVAAYGLACIEQNLHVNEAVQISGVKS